MNKDSWETYRLKDLGEFKTSSVNKKIKNNEVPTKLLNYMDVYNNSFIDSEMKFSLTTAKQSQLTNNNVLKGDVFFTPSSETREDIGHSAVVVEDISNLVYSYHLVRYRIHNDDLVDLYFRAYCFNNTDVLKQFSKLATGSTRYTLSLKDFEQIEIKIPPMKEQQKIASILATFDKNIQLYTKLIENKKKLKKSLSYKFLNFQDRETRELFDCEVRKVSFSSFLSIPKKVLVESPIKDNIISVKLHRNGLRLGYQNDTLKLGATNYYYRHSGQFIYGKQNIFNGAFDILPDEFDGMYSSADIPSLDINEKVIDPGYFLSYMSQLNVYKKLESKSTGTGSKRLHEKELLKEQIYLPPIEIQRQANYPLMLLTTEIEKLEEMLINLKLQKRGLMQLLLTGKVRV